MANETWIGGSPGLSQAEVDARVVSVITTAVGDGEALINNSGALGGATYLDQTAVDARADSRIATKVGLLAAPAVGAVGVVSDEATLNFLGSYRILAETIDASVEFTLTNDAPDAFLTVILTNDGTVGAPTFAAGPTVKLEGAGEWDTASGAINVLRIQCVDATGDGTFHYTISQREA